MSFDEIVAELPKLTGPELQQIAEKAQFWPAWRKGSGKLKKASKFS